EGEALPETAEAAPEAEGDRTAEETKELAAEPEMGLQWDEYLSDMGDGRDQGYAGADEKELPSYEQTLSRRASLSEHLLWQLRLTASDETHLKGAEWIIGNIDEDGYLRASLDELAEQAGLPLAVMEQALAVVQLFDPVGVGSRDLRECLLIQARELDFEETLVELIIRDHLADLEKKRYAQIAKVLNVTLQDVMEASQIIIHEFEPKPGIPYADPDTHYVVPDIYVVKVEDRYVVQLNEDGVPRVRINPYYRKLLTRKDAVDKATRDYIEERMRSAQWLMKGMDQRNKTIYKVAESIVKFQFDFLENGISHLKPMVLKDVAEDISMHESTISRVTTSKYMHSPQGLFPMKFFFTTGFSAGGEGDISSLTVKAAIQKMIKEEDPSSPLKDQQIVDALKERSITIARRTVAKYREELRIPPTSVRKRM
ncbi:MAG: RNA polymerase sigma-54 factor, partial [Nitrospirae bacterium GWD2_57_8]